MKAYCIRNWGFGAQSVLVQKCGSTNYRHCRGGDIAWWNIWLIFQASRPLVYVSMEFDIQRTVHCDIFL